MDEHKGGSGRFGIYFAFVQNNKTVKLSSVFAMVVVIAERSIHIYSYLNNTYIIIDLCSYISFLRPYFSYWLSCDWDSASRVIATERI